MVIPHQEKRPADDVILQPPIGCHAVELPLIVAAEQHAVTEYIEKRRFSLSAGYSDYQIVNHIFFQFTISGLQEEFSTEIHVSACIPKAEYEILEKRIQDSTNGRVRLI